MITPKTTKGKGLLYPFKSNDPENNQHFSYLHSIGHTMLGRRIFEKSKTLDQFQNLVCKVRVGQGHLSRDPTFVLQPQYRYIWTVNY